MGKRDYSKDHHATRQARYRARMIERYGGDPSKNISARALWIIGRPRGQIVQHPKSPATVSPVATHQRHYSATPVDLSGYGRLLGAPALLPVLRNPLLPVESPPVVASHTGPRDSSLALPSLASQLMFLTLAGMILGAWVFLSSLWTLLDRLERGLPLLLHSLNPLR